MLWEIEIRPQGPRRRARPRPRRVHPPDASQRRIDAAHRNGPRLSSRRRPVARSGRRLADELLVDTVVETGRLGALNEREWHRPARHRPAQARRHGPDCPERRRCGPRSRRDGRIGPHLPPLLRAAAAGKGEGRALPQGAGQRSRRAGRRRAAGAGASHDRAPYRFALRHGAAARPRRCCAGKFSRDGAVVTQPRGNADDPDALPRTRPRSDRYGAGDHRPDLVGTLLAQDAQGQIDFDGRSIRQSAQGDDLRRHAGGAPAARSRRLVRQRLRGQRRRRALRRSIITSASRSRRTIGRRRSSRTAGPIPASAASSAIRSAPASAPSPSATPTCSVSARRTCSRRSCRRACCIRSR